MLRVPASAVTDMDAEAAVAAIAVLDELTER